MFCSFFFFFLHLHIDSSNLRSMHQVLLCTCTTANHQRALKGKLCQFWDLNLGLANVYCWLPELGIRQEEFAPTPDVLCHTLMYNTTGKLCFIIINEECSMMAITERYLIYLYLIRRRGQVQVFLNTQQYGEWKLPICKNANAV